MPGIERVGNQGYIAFSKEAPTAKGVPLTSPSIFTMLYEDKLSTNPNFQEQQPIFGNKHATYTTLQGLRNHGGELTLLAEPNTTAYIMDMLYSKSSGTGTSPTTTTFGLSNLSAPNSYTVDISYGNVVKRFMGLEASKYAPVWDDNEMKHKISVSALASFQSALVASAAGSGPYVYTIDTSYDSNPTRGLIAGDLIRGYKPSTGVSVDATITSVTATTITTATQLNLVAGDFIYLRPASPAFSLLQTFLWAKTEFRFGATAAAALTATQTRVESGSTFELMHMFDDDKGAQRSGGFDPAALVRTTGDETLKIKKFFDNPDDAAAFFQLSKGSLVIRHFAGPQNQYEFRVTFNNIKTDTPFPNIKPGEVSFSEIDYHPNYDQTDSRAIQIDVIANAAP